MPEETKPKVDNRRWHIDKSFNLPFFLSLILCGIAIMGYLSEQKEGQKVLQVKVDKNEEEIKTLKTDVRSDLNRIENQQVRIENKLDRLIERKH